MTVMRPGDCYIGGTPGTTVTGAGYTTVIDASLRNQTARAGDGDDAVIGGPNDTIMVGNGHIPSTNFGADLAIKCEYSNYFRNDIGRQWRCAAQPQFGQLNLFATLTVGSGIWNRKKTGSDPNALPLPRSARTEREGAPGRSFSRFARSV
jgi:hypothetical protein